MSRAVFLLLGLLVQLTAARYYKPRPLVCPVDVQVLHHNETLQVREIEVVRVPLPVNDIYLNTVFQTSVVPVTSVTYHTVTAPAQRLQVTDVRLVHETQSLMVVRVDTVTSSVVHTELDLITSTATNYLTEFDTVSVEETFHLTVTDVETRFLELTTTVQGTSFSTLTVTKAQLLTKVVYDQVTETTVVATSTSVSALEETNTHSLTKMITLTVCSP